MCLFQYLCCACACRAGERRDPSWGREPSVAPAALDKVRAASMDLAGSPFSEQMCGMQGVTLCPAE